MTYEQFCWYDEELTDQRLALMQEEEEYDFCGYMINETEEIH